MRLRLEIPLQRPALAGLLRALDEAFDAHAVDADLRARLRLVVEELACNAVEHGGGDGRLTLRVERGDDHVHVELRDTARAFDPLSLPSPDCEAHIDDRPIGGLGVHLVRTLADDVRYAREDGCNVLRLRLPATTD